MEESATLPFWLVIFGAVGGTAALTEIVKAVIGKVTGRAKEEREANKEKAVYEAELLDNLEEARAAVQKVQRMLYEYELYAQGLQQLALRYNIPVAEFPNKPNIKE